MPDSHLKVIFFTITTRITSSIDEFGLLKILLDAQSWTQAYYLSSRVVAVTTTTDLIRIVQRIS